jgi:hypothetical protein
MDAIKDYLKQIEKELRRGDSTEHTHRSTLKILLESMMTGVVATNEPKRIECGAPDFIVTKGHVPLGYIEAKDVGKPLDEIEKGEQMGRYFALGNLILTDYLEFRWYAGGKRKLIARLAASDPDGKLHAFTSGADDLSALLQQFLTSTEAYGSACPGHTPACNRIPLTRRRYRSAETDNGRLPQSAHP